MFGGRVGLTTSINTNIYFDVEREEVGYIGDLPYQLADSLAMYAIMYYNYITIHCLNCFVNCEFLFVFWLVLFLHVVFLFGYICFIIDYCI